MTSPANTRTRTRNRLYLWGLLPSLLLLVFAAKVILMFAAQSAGDSAYDSGDHDGARAEYASNQRWNVIESWRAPFNVGDALFHLEDHEQAIDAFEAALADAPEDRACMIRVNIALSHEAIGDTSMEEDDVLGALQAWRDGRKVLAEGSCDSDDARSTDQRLADKIDQQEAEEPERKQKKEEKKQEQDPELERKRQKVQEKNQQGREQRKDYQELDEYSYRPDRPEQHW